MPSSVMRNVCRPGIGDAAADLHRAELAHRGVAIDVLRQPEDAVGDREDRVPRLVFGVFADEERRDLP